MVKFSDETIVTSFVHKIMRGSLIFSFNCSKVRGGRGTLWPFTCLFMERFKGLLWSRYSTRLPRTLWMQWFRTYGWCVPGVNLGEIWRTHISLHGEAEVTQPTLQLRASTTLSLFPYPLSHTLRSRLLHQLADFKQKLFLFDFVSYRLVVEFR